MKLGILGGTFDPIHNGHLALAQAAMKQLCLNAVLFVPALNPPHKRDREDVTPAAIRKRMVELAIADQPYFELSMIEIDRGGISYTVDTLRDLKKKYPDAALFLIVGEDSFSSFKSWKGYDEIQGMAQIAVARRPHGERQSASKALWIEMPECPFSSTSIREKLKQGRLPDEGLPEKVAEFIGREKIYSAG